MRKRNAFVLWAMVLVVAAGLGGARVWAQSAVVVQEQPGKVVRLDPAAQVIVLEDGRMYRVQRDTVVLLDDQPTAFEQLTPGAMVVVRSGQPVTFQNGQYVVVGPAAAAPPATAPGSVTTITTTPATTFFTNGSGTVARVDVPAGIITLTDGRNLLLGPKSVVQVDGRRAGFAAVVPGAQVVVTEANPVVSRDGRSTVLNQGFRDADTGSALTSDANYAGYEADITHGGMQVQAP